MVEIPIAVEIDEADGEGARLSIGAHSYLLAGPPLLPPGR
jgi:hypothetical protein